MSKICRAVSTFLIAAGFCFLFYYADTQSMSNKFAVLSRPSYYILQNYWYVFLAGIIMLFFSLFGSFFSWLKEMEEKEEILPNAGYSRKKDIIGWLRGSSLDTEQIAEENTLQGESGQGNSAIGDKTEVLTESEKTEILETDDRTELLQAEAKDETEIICGEMQEDKK